MNDTALLYSLFIISFFTDYVTTLAFWHTFNLSIASLICPNYQIIGLVKRGGTPNRKREESDHEKCRAS